MVLLAPSVSNTETLYTTLCSSITQDKLTLDIDQTKCMIFSNTKNEINESVVLNDDALEVVGSFNYLGPIVSYDLRCDDISLRLKKIYIFVS